jgi:hypothetical protein
MALNIRVRSKAGQFNLRQLSGDASLASLKEKIAVEVKSSATLLQCALLPLLDSCPP